MTVGIDAGAINVPSTGHLVTHNAALGHGGVDYAINCPSDVTYNDSTNGFPASYFIHGIGCHLVSNH